MWIIAVVLTATAAITQAEFNNSVCPGPLELQSADVQANFNMDYFPGVYYEVAYHDWTQNPMCPNRKCTRSVKVFHEATNAVYDNFTMYCGVTKTQEKEYIVPFIFNLTATKGFFWGTEEIFHTQYPNTVVAVGDVVHNEATSESQYEWVIEMQCKEEHLLGSHIYFVGINFYCYLANPPQSMMEEMVNAAYKQGLGLWLDQVLDYTNQTDCVY